ncbi:hypothetical protein AVEN_68558-1 [Araneus ventricosus]|uniref:Uncharacterized protein n=1 Tax=Araneus ventricosus TaxID=182803 RepID=A0A4Y2HCV7_ARAVE|nr:hypothetical protein AVEN_68558-1 [Araneus ventricosus]
MYPREFIKETQFATDGYPLNRRRKPEDGAQIATVKMISDSVVIDNRWIVPYSPLLLKIFDAHINVECCNSVKSIKYILKYVHKVYLLPIPVIIALMKFLNIKQVAIFRAMKWREAFLDFPSTNDTPQ